MYDKNNLRPRKEKVFFASGDRVILRHDIPNKPIMIVQTIDKITAFGKEETNGTALLGVTCFWFSSDLCLQKYRFNTKDLIKYREPDA